MIAPTRSRSRSWTAPLAKGSKLGKYRLERPIGSGGFAEVWKALDTVERRAVALKIASPEALRYYGREHVEREAQIASRLHHSHIVAVRNADWIGERFILACDLAKGNLAENTKARKRPDLALELIRQAASGLAHAHREGVLHRDIKPENILIFEDGHAALTDFGLSRLTLGRTLTVTEAGTLGYIAPEQAYGRATLGSDVFSLGMVAYKVLTGVMLKWPFEWPAHGFERFEARVPEPVQKVIQRASEFEPHRRYEDGIAFHEAFERALARHARRQARLGEWQDPYEEAVDHLVRTLELNFRCHSCDGPISEAMGHCPWCGTVENSFVGITPYARTCPDCERGIRSEWTACPWCLHGNFAGNGRRPPLDRQAKRRCPSTGCDGQLRLFMRYCPQCKRSVDKPWTHRSLDAKCARCRWPISKEHWYACPWCGRRNAGCKNKTRRRSTKGRNRNRSRRR